MKINKTIIKKFCQEFVIFGIIILNILGFFIMLQMDNRITHLENEQILLEKKLSVLDERKIILDDYNTFISNKTYNDSNDNSTEYTCYDYANDFKDFYSKKGYDVDIVLGMVKDNENILMHAWNKICLEIEPQSGRIVNESLGYGDLWILDE